MSIQQEHKVWVDGMYPDQPPEVPAAGLVLLLMNVATAHARLRDQRSMPIARRARV